MRDGFFNKEEYHQLMIQLDRTYNYNKEGLYMFCFFIIILDSEIRMTSKPIFVDFWS